MLHWTALNELLFLAKGTLSEEFKYLFANGRKGILRKEHAFFFLRLSTFVDGPAILIVPGTSCSISDVGTCS